MCTVSLQAFANGSDTVLGPSKVSGSADDSDRSQKLINYNLIRSISDDFFQLIGAHLINGNLVEELDAYVEASPDFMQRMSYQQIRLMIAAIAWYQYDMRIFLRYDESRNLLFITSEDQDRRLILFTP
jgi:hypothetical protein